MYRLGTEDFLKNPLTKRWSRNQIGRYGDGKPIYSPCDNLFNRWGDSSCKLWIDQDPGKVTWSNYMQNCAKACCEQGAVKGMNDCKKLSDKKGKGDTLINGISAQCAKGVKGYYDSTTGTWMGPNQVCNWPDDCMKTCCQQRFLGDGNCDAYISDWNKLGSKVPGWPKKCLKDGRLCSKADPKCVEHDDAGVY